MTLHFMLIKWIYLVSFFCCLLIDMKEKESMLDVFGWLRFIGTVGHQPCMVNGLRLFMSSQAGWENVIDGKIAINKPKLCLWQYIEILIPSAYC